jgi:glyoxylase I family protein
LTQSRYTPDMFQGIEHTAIASPDPERLAQWYETHLDFVVNFRSSGSRTTFVKAPDGSMIEIIEANSAPSHPQQMRAPGLRHLAIQVTDFPEAYGKLKSQGVNFLTAPETSKGNTVAFFTDCDGNLLHLLHREKPLP